MFKKWAERWSNWVGDRSMELAIRERLREEGYKSLRSEICTCRLVAIQRPGWVRVYQFEVRAFRADEQEQTLYGVVRDDGRRGSEVEFFEDRLQRNRRRDAWSDGLIIAPNVDR